MKKYYKVVRQDGARLVSLVMGADGSHRKLQRTYSTDGWTHGLNETPVMAFTNRTEASRYANWYRGQVWLAEVKRPRKLNMLIEIGCAPRDMLAFWKQVAGKRWWALGYEGKRTGAPAGTVACEAIRLVRRS